MSRLFITLSVILLIATSALANPLIFQDPTQAIHLFNNANHYKASDIFGNFKQEQSFANSKKVLFSKDKEEIWLSLISNETLSILTSNDYGNSYKNIKTTVNIKNGKLLKQLVQNQIIHLIYQSDDKTYYIRSENQGNSFTPPMLLSDIKIKSIDFIGKDGILFICLLFNDQKTIKLFESYDFGQSFKDEKIETNWFKLTEELFLFFDQNNNPALLALTYDANKYEVIRLIKSEETDSWKAKVLFESPEKITNIQLAPLNYPNSFIISYNNKFWRITSDYAENFSEEREIISPNDDFVALFSNTNQLYWVSDKKPNQISNNQPAKITLPERIITNTKEINLNLSSYDLENDPLFYIVNISSTNNFEEENTISFSLDKTEKSIALPFNTTTSYIYAFVSDGISSSKTSNLCEVVLDTASPEVVSADYPRTINKKNFDLKLSFSEAVTFEGTPKFIVNEKKLKLETLKFFGSSLEAKIIISSINEGEYKLLFDNIFDYANNPIQNRDDLKLLIDHESPMLEIKSPSNNSWIKNGATLIVNTSVEDLQNDIPDNPVIVLSIDNFKTDNKLQYLSDQSKIFGFLNIPSNLSDGKHKLEIKIKDLKDNIGISSIDFNIDSKSPKVLPPSSPNSKIIISYTENGSGIDLDSSIINISFASKEAEGTFEVTADGVLFHPKEELNEGKYSVDITLRDKVGNSSLSLISHVDIKDESFLAKNVESESTNNIVRYGPNPFNPLNGTLRLEYITANSSNATLYIFSLTGQNLYRSESGANTNHIFTWDGKDQFGKTLANGVYLFAINNQSSSGSSVDRGKIIILQ